MLYIGNLDSILSAIGQEHEMLLCDKLKEKNLSFLGKTIRDLLITFFKSLLPLCEHMDVTDAVALISF